MPKPITVTASALRTGVDAALTNAKRLLRDAETLLRAGAVPTAHSLAILATEEAAKADIWRGLVDGDKETVTLTDEHHMVRLEHVQLALSYLDILLAVLDDPSYEGPTDAQSGRKIREVAESVNAAKQRGFYVDVADGEVLEPGLIDRDEADGAIRLAHVYISMVEELEADDM